MFTFGFSWRWALVIWLSVVGVAVVISLGFVVWTHLQLGEFSPGALIFMTLVSALFEATFTYPMRDFAFVVQRSGQLQLWWLIIPNLALLGLIPAIVGGFLASFEARANGRGDRK